MLKGGGILVYILVRMGCTECLCMCASLCMCAFVGLCVSKVMAYLIEAFMSIYACMSCVGFYVIPFGGNTVLCNGGDTHITDFFFCECN